MVRFEGRRFTLTDWEEEAKAFRQIVELGGSTQVFGVEPCCCVPPRVFFRDAIQVVQECATKRRACGDGHGRLWPTYFWPTEFGQTDFGRTCQTDFGQIEFDLLCVVCCAVWRGCFVHGFMEWGFTCGCSFEGLGFGDVRCQRTALRRTAQNIALFSHLPPQNSFFSSLFWRREERVFL